MRFTPLILTGLFALTASAQNATTSASYPVNSEQAAITKCIEACDAGDVSCTSKCIAVPNPSDSDVNATNDCVTACPKGSGTDADNAAYQSCVEGCISQHYFTATTGAAGVVVANPTGTALSDSGTTGVTRTNVVVVSTMVSGSFTTTITSTSAASGAEPTETGSDDDNKGDTSTALVESTRSAGGAAGRAAGAVGGLGGFLWAVAALL
ncbi:hypothetical protein NEUTE1DRAFT_106609 [Neurospora tetrasperma FGSC 2508]|uniref:Extracellular membrane protein CFEM domain-containing protein n=1 Tax=Neurospora tetrasperma (strain FGSC 2508 / ATCC MYA-4615 / P0657) TaxID=510951 RepID=F8MZP6_NEUT8|nr:uncharacterized protein NEUTE1DRAFT_106609 [Neurospora tetrasperma FGSC 2508]EGO53736.1 hypothetical protein NEUTE1DRAFT_106609 [Neurospora tetrasperma FGSC 2508]EGZ76184.1 hypothetical protein NEUTE2DRAFT_51359 [Neurospora tetrasperma FGSC 2509]